MTGATASVNPVDTRAGVWHNDPMIELDLQAALRGVLPEALALGTPRSALAEALGGAPDRALHAPRGTDILRYGDIEFHLATEAHESEPRLWMIYSDHATYEGAGSLVVLAGWLKPGLPKDDVLAHLAEAGLLPDPPVRVAGVEKLRVGRWMQLYFDGEGEPDFDGTPRLGAFALLARPRSGARAG